MSPDAEVVDPPIIPPEEVKTPEETAPKTSKRGWPKGKPRGPRKNSASRAMSDLHASLKDGAMGVSVGIMFATGSLAAAADPRVTDALEARADKMAGAWCAVAKENPRVAQTLEQLMTGGVWLGAAANTLAFGVLVLTFTGRAPLPGHLAKTLIPELRPFDFGAPPTPDIHEEPVADGPESA